MYLLNFSKKTTLVFQGSITRKRINQQKQIILNLFEYQDWSVEQSIQIEAHICELLRYYPKGHDTFRQLLVYLDTQKIVIPTYRNLKDMFTKAFVNEGDSFDRIFESSVSRLFKNNLVDISVLHGDGTTTAAKKGGDNIGRSGHKHMSGDKVVSISDRNCNVIAPFVTAPGNRNESPMFPDAFKSLKRIAKAVGFSLSGCVMSLDGVYDCKQNRKMIFNANMTPNINENKRNRKANKRGRKRFFSASIFKERFRTIERVFAWEDKFKRLIVRFEHISAHHYSMKTIAYTMINLRHFCRP